MSIPAKKKKVFVGLSGGVDSAVSAALLKKEGYDVTGVFVRIALPGYPCSAGEDRREAVRVAAHLGLPFLDIDLSREYQQKIFQHAMEAYARGETPNPDARCNREIKFGLLYDFAMSRSAEYLATGHYARVKNGQLLAGKDSEKDQSYFLWAVPEERLARVLFPVGGLHKPQVRALAKKFGLPNAERRDSQGLCFLGGVSIEDALVRELALVGGEVVDLQGNGIGAHRGAALYTMGQRHGFQVRASGASAEPLFVVGKDVVRNTITVAPRQKKDASFFSKKKIQAFFQTVCLREENWIGEVPDGAYQARFRYRQKLFSAKLSRVGARTIVKIKTQEPIPIGQSLVLYTGARCAGGGVIAQVDSVQ